MLGRLHAPLRLVLVAVIVAACAGTGPTEAALSPVPITDIKMVAGKWGGLVTGISAQQKDWVDVTIAPVIVAVVVAVVVVSA